MKYKMRGIFIFLFVGILSFVLVACGNDTVTVVFDTDGGTAVASIQVTKGSKISKFDDPTRDNYVFKGWYKESSKDNEWIFDVDTVDSNITLYAKWESVPTTIEQFTVTFNPGYGDVNPESIKVNKDGLATRPNALYTGHQLVGWYKESSFENVWDFAVDKVTSHITLYAKWEVAMVAEGTAITSQEAFYQLVTGVTSHKSGDKFYLANDLNFESFDWAPVEGESAVFEGIFDGNGKKLYNLNIQTNNIGGIFAKISGATIKNLTIDNVHVVSTGERAGILAGQTEKSNQSETTLSNHIENITILNSSAHAKNDGGAGALMGQNKWVLDVSNIVVTNTRIHNGLKNAGGLIGQLDGNNLTIKDVLIDAVITADGENAGGILGELKNLKPGDALAPSDLFIENAVVRASISSLRYSGGLIGKNAANTADESVSKANLKHVVAMVNVWNTGGNKNDIGYLASRPAAFSSALDHVYVVGSGLGHLTPKGNNAPTAVLATLDDLVVDHFTGFDSELWTLVANAMPSLKGNSVEVGHLVTLDVEGSLTKQYVKNDLLPALYIPVKTDFAFDGWFVDAEMTIAYDDSSIKEEMTLYAKFEVRHTVSFDVAGGVAIPVIQVTDGGTFTLPETAVKAGYVFNGWFADAEFTEEFVVSSVTESIVVYAKFTDETSPVISVDPTAGVISLAPNQPFIWTIHIDDVEPKLIEIDHSLANAFPEFTLYADADNPYGSDDARLNFESLGVSVTYNAATKNWTINFGETITETLVSNGVTFYIVAEDMSGNIFGSMDPVTEDNTFSYTFNIITTTYIVSFDTDGGSTITDLQVFEGQQLTLPSNPTKSGFQFAGWFTDAAAEITFDPESVILADLTLYAKWIEVTFDEDFIEINAASDFQTIVSGSNSGKKYYLSTDLDFTDITWTIEATGTSFQGYIDGNGKTISNIVITSTGYGGVFARTNGATIKNLIVDNVKVTAAGRGGILIGRVENNTTTLENITIKNSEISAADSNGAGIIGQVSNGLNASNITILNSSIKNTAKNAGGFIGRVDSANGKAVLTNVLISGVNVETATGTGDTGNGLLIGYIANAAGASVDAENIAVINSDANTTASRGVLIGYLRSPGAMTINNAYVNITFTEGTIKSGLQAHTHASDTPIYLDVTTVYGVINHAVSGTGSVGLLTSNVQPSINFDAWLADVLPSLYHNSFFSMIKEQV